jgi:hypothetical protein
MSFNESNTVEQMILDAVTKIGNSDGKNLRENHPDWGGSLGGEFKPVHWDYLPAAQIPRQSGDVMVETWIR